MIIPVRCFTCGHTIGDMWEYYVKRSNEIIEKQKQKQKQKQNKKDSEDEAKKSVDGDCPASLKYFDSLHTGEILDELQLRRMCCRRMLVTHVDFINDI